MSNWKSTVTNLFSPVAKRSKPVNDTAIPTKNNNMSQGLKRKADPYEMPDGEEGLDVATPASRVRSRRTSEAPSSVKSRTSASKAKRQSTGKRLPFFGNSQPATSQPKIQAQTNGEDGEPPRAPVADMGGAPVADMGGAGFLLQKSEPEETIPSEKATGKVTTSPEPAEGKTIRAQPMGRDAEELLAKKVEDGDMHEIKKLLEHKVSDADQGRVLLLVQWVNDLEGTWEPEEGIQDGASEILFDYWKKQGGRNKALFEKRKGAEPLLKEQYFVYKILTHERARSTFQFEVQWVGYPAGKAQTSVETEAKLKKIAPELLEEYWELQGGRQQFLAKRGRAKKARIA